MKTSLSPIAIAVLLVGPGLTAWARQDTPQEPAAPPVAKPAKVRAIAADPADPLLARVRVEQDDPQDLTDEELALQDKLRALEKRAAELEAALRDRLDATEARARAQATEQGAVRQLIDSEEGYEALRSRVQDYVQRVDPERRARRGLAVRDLLEAAPARVSEIQDEEVRAKVQEAIERAQAKLAPQAAERAEAFRAQAEELRARAEAQRELAEAKRAEVERLRYSEAHPRYRALQDEAAEHQGNAEEARAEMRARRAEGALRREEQELANAKRDAERSRQQAENVRRTLEQELAKREVQRRREENRLRSELDSERARLAEMRAKLEQTHAEMKGNAPRPERPRATDLRVERAAPRAAPQRPTSSDMTIIVERGDVHVHTGGGAPRVITPRESGQPADNAFFGRDVPRPAAPARPEPAARPDPPGTTKAPAPVLYWSTTVRPEGFAQSNLEYRKVYGNDTRRFLVDPDFELELPADPFEYIEMDFELPDVEFELPEVEFELPEVEIEAPELFLKVPAVLEAEPECEPEPEDEFEGGVVVRGDGMELRADRVSFDLAASPAERAPTQAELLDRILRLSEELKAEVGALRGELRELREVVRDAPRR